jgi:diguanylate cyclase
MYKVFDCIATQHDLRLLALAIAICALSSYTTISLLHHVRWHVPRSGGRMWMVWLAASALSTGFGIWATHFIAMLAFTPGLATAYNIELTVLSLVVAIAITGLGLAIAIMQRWSATLGGALLGGGIAAMHYVGMAAFEVPGRIAWDVTLVCTSILLGVAFGAAALLIGLRCQARSYTALGAFLLTAAICGLHFTAMGAASVSPDPTVRT